MPEASAAPPSPPSYLSATRPALPPLAPTSEPLPPLSAKPVPPTPQVKVAEIPTLIAWTTFLDRLARWSDADLRATDVTLLQDPPPWSLWLEDYYLMYHPETWVILEADYETEKEYLSNLIRWILQRKATRCDVEELTSLREERDRVACMLMDRFQKLYGLHFVRKRYLAYYRGELPGKSDDEILATTLRNEDYPPCVIKAHSVWPLPLPSPHPRLFRLIDLPESALLPFTVPGIHTPFTRAFRAEQEEAEDDDDDPPQYPPRLVEETAEGGEGGR